ncbi:hypothetical protein [Bacteroides cellulosilyticus]|uniref:Uncharacterized protein n=1 Tax=Bacteroides cellulosilyticus TaxID=246787 RepID=A0A642PUH5_9BACE|nr:hypothetical protein [Bacteroides cellulosilyticus]KAA5416525.1 hypothetical protein F2Y81_15315 [Bacteroides cellulosilyticus]
MGKLNEAAQVSTIGSEYVLLTDSNGLPVRISKNNLAEVIRSVMNEATTEKNGLKPASDVRKEKMIATQTSRVVYECNNTTAMSTSLLISLAAYGGGPMTLFYMTINRSADILKAPAIILNRIGGANAPTTPRFKMWSNESTGVFKIILEHTQYTPSIYVKLLNTILPSTDAIPLSVANQDEVDAATYIDVT